MSIIFIDDIIFNDKSQERKVNLKNCFFFIILNMISLICTCCFIFFYYKIPNYQNNPNSLTLYLIVISGLLSFLYFIIFTQLYFMISNKISLSIKWIVCLTNNIYVTYYNYKNNIDKRIKFYKYHLIILFLTYFNIEL